MFPLEPLVDELDRQIQHWVGGAFLGDFPRPDTWPDAADPLLAALVGAMKAASVIKWPVPTEAMLDALEGAFWARDDARQYAWETVALYRESEAMLERLAPKMIALAALQLSLPVLIAHADKAQAAHDRLRDSLDSVDRLEQSLLRLTA